MLDGHPHKYEGNLPPLSSSGGGGVDGGRGRAVRCAPLQWIVSCLLDVSLASCSWRRSRGSDTRANPREQLGYNVNMLNWHSRGDDDDGGWWWRMHG